MGVLGQKSVKENIKKLQAEKAKYKRQGDTRNVERIQRSIDFKKSCLPKK